MAKQPQNQRNQGRGGGGRNPRGGGGSRCPLCPTYGRDGQFGHPQPNVLPKDRDACILCRPNYTVHAKVTLGVLNKVGMDPVGVQWLTVTTFENGLAKAMPFILQLKDWWFGKLVNRPASGDNLLADEYICLQPGEQVEPDQIIFNDSGVARIPICLPAPTPRKLTVSLVSRDAKDEIEVPEYPTTTIAAHLTREGDTQYVNVETRKDDILTALPFRLELEGQADQKVLADRATFIDGRIQIALLPAAKLRQLKVQLLFDSEQSQTIEVPGKELKAGLIDVWATSDGRQNVVMVHVTIDGKPDQPTLETNDEGLAQVAVPFDRVSPRSVRAVAVDFKAEPFAGQIPRHALTMKTGDVAVERHDTGTHWQVELQTYVNGEQASAVVLFALMGEPERELITNQHGYLLVDFDYSRQERTVQISLIGVSADTKHVKIPPCFTGPRVRPGASLVEHLLAGLFG